MQSGDVASDLTDVISDLQSEVNSVRFSPSTVQERGLSLMDCGKRCITNDFAAMRQAGYHSTRRLIRSHCVNAIQLSMITISTDTVISET